MSRLRSLSIRHVWIGLTVGATFIGPASAHIRLPDIYWTLLIGAWMVANGHLLEGDPFTAALWLLPPATALWANLHGSFFTGFVLLGCAIAARVLSSRSLYAARPYVLTLVGCLLASLINPYGPGLLVYVASIGSNPVIRDYITEWSPTSVSWREGIMFFTSVAVLGGIILKSRLRLTVLEVLVLLAFGYLAWSSIRAVVWWGLV